MYTAKTISARSMGATKATGTKTKFSNVKLEYTSKAYTGNALKPAVSVSDKVNGKTVILKEGTDYIVRYFNNTNAGTASVNVVGKGNYSGRVRILFKIIE